MRPGSRDGAPGEMSDTDLLIGELSHNSSRCGVLEGICTLCCAMQSEAARPESRLKSPFGPRLLQLSVVALALPAALVSAWRTLIAQPLVPSDEQLNIATFILARHQPPHLALDFVYGTSNPSSFYIPFQLDVFEWLWQTTGSVQGAIAIQVIPLVVVTIAAAALSTYFLTHQALPALVVGLSALNYRTLLSAGEIWGLGPSWAVLPRAWAAPLSFAALALWLRANDSTSRMYHVVCGITCGVTVNVHPPTGIPLSGAIIGASLVHVLTNRRRWSEPLVLLVACGVGAAPFLASYASSVAVAAPIDFESFMAAARLRIGWVFLPGVLQTLTRSFTPGSEGFAINASLVGGVALAVIVLLVHRKHRQLSALALISGLVLVGCIIVPLAAQEVLMRIGRSPMPTIDLIRGLRLLIPVALIVGGLGLAVCFRSKTWHRMLAIPMSCLLLLDAATAQSFAATAALALVAGAVTSAWWVLPESRPRITRTAPAVVALLLVAQPVVGMLLTPMAGAACCVAQPLPTSERSIDELITWVRTLPGNTIIDTSAMQERAALRMRLETTHAATLIPKDGNVLLYSDPPKAIAWAARSQRARDVTLRTDVAGLRAAAREWGASLVVVDRLVWPELISGVNVTATWAGIAGPTQRDWLGIWEIGQSDSDAGRLAVKYTGGSATGSVGLTIPRTTGGGRYEVRFFTNDTWVRLAVSNPFSVSNDGTCSASPTPLSAPSLSTTWCGMTEPVFENSRFTVFPP
jgi:hypothetical protein